MYFSLEVPWRDLPKKPHKTSTHKTEKVEPLALLYLQKKWSPLPWKSTQRSTRSVREPMESSTRPRMIWFGRYFAHFRCFLVSSHRVDDFPSPFGFFWRFLASFASFASLSVFHIFCTRELQHTSGIEWCLFAASHLASA